MPQCPRCKGDMPLLSKICPACGYVTEEGGNLTAEEQINLLEQAVFRFKQLPRPTFLTSLRDMLGIVIFLLTIYFLTMAYLTESTICYIIGGVFLLVLQYFVGRLVISWFKPSVKAEVTNLKNEFEYNERIARRNFGKNTEVARQIDAITADMIEIDDMHKAAKRRIFRIWLIIAAVFVLFASGTISLAKYQESKEAETAEYGHFQRSVNAYLRSGENTEYTGDVTRLTLINSMIADGAADLAERFFIDHCQKRMGDYECAQSIVNEYLRRGDSAGAAAFADKVELRYASDNKKLKKLIK